MKRSLRNFKTELHSSIGSACYTTDQIFFWNKFQKMLRELHLLLYSFYSQGLQPNSRTFLTPLSCYLIKLLSNKPVVVFTWKGYLLLVLQEKAIGGYLQVSHNFVFQRKVIITLFEQKGEDFVWLPPEEKATFWLQWHVPMGCCNVQCRPCTSPDCRRCV